MCKKKQKVPQPLQLSITTTLSVSNHQHRPDHSLPAKILWLDKGSGGH
jgi:hypothetical protein